MAAKKVKKKKYEAEQFLFDFVKWIINPLFPVNAYVINRADFFKIPPENLPEGSILHAGLLWVILALTDDEKQKINVPIERV